MVEVNVLAYWAKGCAFGLETTSLRTKPGSLLLLALVFL